MAMTTGSLQSAITSILGRLETEHEGLTELDGRIGDGDLGITLLKAFRELDKSSPGLPNTDVGAALMQCGAAVAKVSSSSFGTLLATGLMSAAKATKGRAEVEWQEVPGLMENAVAAMAARGKSSLGDKTVLDALSQAAESAAGSTEAADVLAASRAGIAQALENFRDKPNRIGRARIFGDRTVGMDDPGMVALKVMAAAL
jgi:dihydroxyacetone kinase-like protein